MRKAVLLCFLSLFLFVVSISSPAWAGDTVKVFLLAGQSNMEGNNTPAVMLDVLICHANSDFTHDTLTCGSTDIPTDELTTRYLDNNQILDGYNALNATDPDNPVVIRLGQFLCTAGKLDLAGQNCGTLNFDLTDRFFATACGYYYHTGNARFQWAYDPFKQMTTAMGLTQIYDEGYLNDELITDRPDVTVLQFRATLAGDGNPVVAPPIPGDIDRSGRVDIEDPALFTAWWRYVPCDPDNNWCGGADFTTNGGVSPADLKTIIQNWLKTEE